MRNIKLTLSYDGTNFSGFELQPGNRTIRSELEKALRKIHGKKISVISASRTDAGVHALSNVINFKIDSSIPTSKLPQALNFYLPEDIRILKAEDREKGFNARFDSKSKEYEYLIYNGPVLNPLFRRFVWQVKPKLVISAMRRAAKFLIGKHDFSSFCAAGGDDKDFVRIIHSLEIGYWSLVIWKGVNIRVLSLRVTANGYLYKMVRNIVGTLMEVGSGKILPGEIEPILMAKDRKLAGRTAPAAGLCLIKVNY